MTSAGFRQAIIVFIAIVVTISILTFGNLFPSAAQDNIKILEEPASQGRRITPAGSLILDARTNQVAVGSLPVDFLRSPDTGGKDGKGRYLLAINSGFGVQFSAGTSRGQQSIAVIDLNTGPEPKVVQNIYFPTPQSVNFGARFDEKADTDGSFRLFVSGGFENKIWLFKFFPNADVPIVVTIDEKDKDKKITNLSIDVSAFATNAPSPN